MEKKIDENVDSIYINEAQLLLAEKRTSLASLRAGIAIFALPLGIVSFLIVTSGSYDLANVFLLFVPLITISLLLAILGSYMILRAVNKIRHFDRMMNELKKEHSILSNLLD
jgi:uncharacterized membrane protein YidH (DUF202 family)